VGVVAQKLRTNEMAVFIGLFAVAVSGLPFVLLGFPGMVLFYFFLPQVTNGLFF
jgi:hypothetical protein